MKTVQVKLGCSFSNLFSVDKGLSRFPIINMDGVKTQRISFYPCIMSFKYDGLLETPTVYNAFSVGD